MGGDKEGGEKIKANKTTTCPQNLSSPDGKAEWRVKTVNGRMNK